MWRKANSETAKKRRDREILQPWHPKTKASYQPAAPHPPTPAPNGSSRST